MLHTPSPVTESCTLSLHDALPISGGLEVSALHNHFFHDEPKVYFMHIGGMGEPAKLAAAVKGVWDAIKKVRADQPKPATRFTGAAPKAGKVTAETIEKTLGHRSEER